MEEKEPKKNNYNFAIGLVVGIILYKVIDDVLLPLLF